VLYSTMPISIVNLELTSGARTFGVKFNGALDETEKAKYGCGIYISGCAVGSIASKCPEMIIGWQVVKVNKVDFRDKTMFDIKRTVMSGTPGKLYMELEQNAELFRTYNMVREVTKATNDPKHPTTIVELEKSAEGCFGLRFGGVLDAREKNYTGYGNPSS